MSELLKTCLYLVVGAVALGIGLLVKPDQTIRPAPLDAGQPFWKEFKPEDVTSLEIVGFDEQTGQQLPFRVARQSTGDWQLPSHDNYPTDQHERLGEATRSVAYLTKGTVESERKSDHTLYGVIDPQGATPGTEGVGTKVVLLDRNNNKLVDLIVGKEASRSGDQNPDPIHGNPPSGGAFRYVRVPGQDRVYTAKLDLAKLSTKFNEWIETDLLKLDSWKIKKISVDNYNASLVPTVTGGGEVEYRVGLQERERLLLDYNDRAAANDPQGATKWALTWQQFQPDTRTYKTIPLEANEELNTTRLDEMRQALDDLKIVDVHRKPEELIPLLAAKGEGALKPGPETVTLLADAGYYLMPNGRVLSKFGDMTVSTEEGLEYHLRFGERVQARKSANEQADPPAVEAETPESSTEGTRYLLVTAGFNPDLLPQPQYESYPEAPKPETPATEPPATTTPMPMPEPMPSSTETPKPEVPKPEPTKTETPTTTPETPKPEPMKTEPTKTEVPAKTEPTKAETPTKTEPTKTEPPAKSETPTKTEATKTEPPAKAEPTKSEVPTKTEPTKSETPTKTEPAKSEPTKTEAPAKAEPPTKSEAPTKTEPTKSEVPVKTEPTKSEPSTSEPTKSETPTKSEPTKSKAPKSAPTKTEPMKSEAVTPTKTEVTSSEPKTEPKKTPPMPETPAKSETPKAEPSKSAAEKSEPTKAESAKQEPAPSEAEATKEEPAKPAPEPTKSETPMKEESTKEPAPAQEPETTDDAGDCNQSPDATTSREPTEPVTTTPATTTPATAAAPATTPAATPEDPQAKLRREIDQRNEQKRKAFEQQVADGQQRADRLNKRFASWYYIISEDEFKKLRVERAGIINQKKADGTGDQPGDFNLLKGGLPGFPGFPGMPARQP